MEGWADWFELEQRPADHPALKKQLLGQASSEAEVSVDLQAQDWLLPRRQVSGERPVSEVLVSQV